MQSEFLQIVDKHQNIIHKVSQMYRDTVQDQEDLFQEIVFQLWKSFPKFRKEAKVSTWMYRIALNTAISVFRKKYPKIDYEEQLPEQLQIQNSDEGSENQERMYSALRRLNDAERALMALYLEDYSYREIGEVMGIGENNVAVRLNRIKNKLKRILTK